MTATITVPAHTTNDAIFSDETTRRLRDGHGRIGSVASRLLSLRNMLAAVFRQAVTEFDFVEEPGLAEEQYQLDLTEYKVELCVASRNHTHRGERAIKRLATALDVNKLLRSMQIEWASHRSDELNAEYLLVNDLVMRTFVLCSQEPCYEVEIDEGYWSIYFEDRKGNTYAEIIISRQRTPG